jgi:type I restriction enzyme S subunit
MKTNEKKNMTPALRFPGFTGDWEQRKFKELFEERRDKTTRENEDTLLSCAITGIYLNSDLFSHFRGSSTIGYLKVKRNDLILSAQNLHLGNANVNLEFDHGIISPAYKVFSIRDGDPNFIQAWVKKDSTKNFFLAATTEGASQCRKNIEWNALFNQVIAVPEIEEQKQIGTFFKELDTLITLHQRKCDELSEFKKGCLQKMFPKKGECVPEIRFPGFTGDWEQRKLSDLVDVCSGMDYKHLSIGNIPVFGTGGYMLSVDKALSYDRDAIGIGRKGTIDKPYILKAPFWTVDTLFYCIPRDEGTLNFDYDLFQCIDWKQKDESTGVPSLSKVAINDTDVMVPKTDEQKKIGYFFEELDLVITLHQQKVDELKEFKKGMLQQMFV